MGEDQEPVRIRGCEHLALLLILSGSLAAVLALLAAGAWLTLPAAVALIRG